MGGGAYRAAGIEPPTLVPSRVRRPRRIDWEVLSQARREQLGGGPSWWVTSYEERQLVEPYSTIGTDALDAWETMWDDSFEVISP